MTGTMPDQPLPSRRNRLPATTWPGIAVGVLTLLSLIALIVAAVAGYEVPSGSRPLVVLFFAVGMAITCTLLGSSAAISGKIPLDYAREHPMRFGATGAAAMVVITLAAGRALYAGEQFTDASGRVTLGTHGSVLRAEGLGLPAKGSADPAERRYTAKRAAEIDAKRNLAMQLGEKIKADASTDGGRITKDTTQNQVDAVMRGARVVEVHDEADGSVRVIMEAPAP